LLSTPPETEREVLFLKFQSGLSYREIGAVTGHSVSYVGYRIHTGIKALRAAHAARIAAEPSRNGHAHGRPALLSPASNRLSALR
jgi:DNA-directed RNA polymerase specialized sigma24 family protein